MSSPKKLFIDPFLRRVSVFTAVSQASLHTLNVTFEELPTVSELTELFNALYHTNMCFGKFSFYNKWIFPAVPDDIKFSKAELDVLNSKMKSVYLRCNTKCSRCNKFTECSSVNLDRNDLSSLWMSMYLSKGKNFFERRF